MTLACLNLALNSSFSASSALACLFILELVTIAGKINRIHPPVRMELLGFLEISLLDFTLSGSFLQVKQSIEVNPRCPEVLLLGLSQ